MPISPELIRELNNNNSSLRELRLAEKKLTLEDIKNIAAALQHNKTLTLLDISFNGIDADGATVIADALKLNTTLLTLDISFNDLGDTGIAAIAKSLEINKTLTKLNIFRNWITDIGIAAMAYALIINKTLVSVNMRQNCISYSGLKDFLKLLFDSETPNTTIYELKIDENSFSSYSQKIKYHWLVDNNRPFYKNQRALLRAMLTLTAKKTSSQLSIQNLPTELIAIILKFAFSTVFAPQYFSEFYKSLSENRLLTKHTLSMAHEEKKVARFTFKSENIRRKGADVLVKNTTNATIKFSLKDNPVPITPTPTLTFNLLLADILKDTQHWTQQGRGIFKPHTPRHIERLQKCFNYPPKNSENKSDQLQLTVDAIRILITAIESISPARRVDTASFYKTQLAEGLKALNIEDSATFKKIYGMQPIISSASAANKNKRF